MRWGSRIFQLRLKMVAASPVLWVLLLIAILFSLLPILQYKQNKQNIIPIAVINRDSGQYSLEFIDLLKNLSSITIIENETFESAQRKLSIGDYEAVVEITEEFSTQVIETDFSRVFTIYVSPSSSVAAFLVEVMAEKYIEIWGEALVLNDFRDLMHNNGLPLSEEELVAFKAEIKETVVENSLIFLDIRLAEGEFQQEVERNPENALRQSALYYCALVIIFIFLSCRWVIDLRMKGIGVRMHSMGITSTTVIISSSLAMALLCEAFLFVSLMIGMLILHTSLLLVLEILAAALLYFIAAIGISISFSAMIKESVSLMLISPIAVMVNSLFGGMLNTLPVLTVLWQKILFALPGRQLTEALYAGNYLPLVVGAVIYSALGVGAVNLFEMFKIRESGDS